MTPDVSGPLFAWPRPEGLPWLALLPLLAALAAVVPLLLGLVRGRLQPAAGVAGVLLLPLVAYWLAGLFILERSKRVDFCGSCHVMAPVVASVQGNDGSLASMHYAHGAVPYEEACYICHSGYGIWGTVDAKRAGIAHMWNTVTGDYDLPITLRGPFNIDSCLNCHAPAATFRGVEAHRDMDLQQALVAREMSCTGVCHPSAHPETALQGGGDAS